MAHVKGIQEDICNEKEISTAPCGRGNPDCFVFRGGDAGGRENRSGDVSISVMIPIIPMLKRGCAFAEGKGFLERQCADSCDGP